jgi:hypothetical protein
MKVVKSNRSIALNCGEENALQVNVSRWRLTVRKRPLVRQRRPEIARHLFDSPFGKSQDLTVLYALVSRSYKDECYLPLLSQAAKHRSVMPCFRQARPIHSSTRARSAPRRSKVNFAQAAFAPRTGLTPEATSYHSCYHNLNHAILRSFP